MVQRDDRSESGTQTRLHDPVVVKCCSRHVAAFGFDARPFNGEAVRIEAQFRQKGDVFAVTVVVITRIT